MTPAEFKERMPEFAGESDTRVQSIIDRAAPYFNVERWGTLYPDGLAYWIAHNIALASAIAANPAAATGDLTGTEVGRTKRVGEASVQVSKSEAMLLKQADSPFMRTLYGQQYLYLLRRIIPGALAV